MGVRICKNGVLSATNISHLAPIHDMKLKTLDDGSIWALIFYHYAHSGNALFTTVDEVLNTQSLDKYSRLYLLNSDRFRSAADNKFEFMICYPLESDKYNRWKQSNNPCDEYEGDIEYNIETSVTSTMRGTVAGYEPISIAWTSGYSTLFGGLARYNSNTDIINKSYLIGSIVSNDSWYFSIGCFDSWNRGIPGNGLSTTEGSQCVELWVRIDNTNSANKVSFFSDCITASDIIEI